MPQDILLRNVTETDNTYLLDAMKSLQENYVRATQNGTVNVTAMEDVLSAWEGTQVRGLHISRLLLFHDVQEYKQLQWWA